MKTNKPIYATWFILILFLANVKAQPHIDSLKIIPGNPSEVDTVKVVAYTFSTGAPCNMTFYEITAEDSVITVNTHYLSGPLTVLCNSIDTAIIGVLNADCHEVLYMMGDTSLPVVYDVDTISVCIQQSGGLKSEEFVDRGVKIWPNPFSTATTVFINKEQLRFPVEIIMVDIVGREVKRLGNISSREIAIAKDHLISGMYFIKVMGAGNTVSIVKVMVE